jgi:hypothetical protein
MFRSALIRKHPFDAETFPRHSDSGACLEILGESDFGFIHQVLTYTRRPVEAQTSLSVRLNSYLAEQLVALARYGPTFLTEDEYSARYRLLLQRYHRFLAAKLLHRSDSTFWQYHRDRAATAGVPLTPARLGLALLSLVGSIAIRPVRPLGRVLRAVRNLTRRQSASHVSGARLHEPAPTRPDGGRVVGTPSTDRFNAAG